MELVLSRSVVAPPRRRRLVLAVTAVNLGALVTALVLATSLGARGGPPVPRRTAPPAVFAIPAPAVPTAWPAPAAPPPERGDARTRALRDFSSTDFDRVLRGYRALASDPDLAVWLLANLLVRDQSAPLVDTADLIYPCAKRFYGHGWMVWYELDRIQDRAGWALEELTRRDFGFRATGDCGETSRAHTAAAVARVRAWLGGQEFDYRGDFLAALAGADRDRAQRALVALRNSYDTPLPLITCDDYTGRITRTLSSIATRRSRSAAIARAILDDPPWAARCVTHASR